MAYHLVEVFCVGSPPQRAALMMRDPNSCVNIGVMAGAAHRLEHRVEGVTHKARQVAIERGVVGSDERQNRRHATTFYGEERHHL